VLQIMDRSNRGADALKVVAAIREPREGREAHRTPTRVRVHLHHLAGRGSGRRRSWGSRKPRLHCRLSATPAVRGGGSRGGRAVFCPLIALRHGDLAQRAPAMRAMLLRIVSQRVLEAVKPCMWQCDRLPSDANDDDRTVVVVSQR
jgi:hypothetical protein